MAEARISVRVQPKARRAGVTVSEAGGITVRVSAPPERGKANAAVIEAIANALAVAPSVLKIARGNTSRDKVLVVEGLTKDEVMSRLLNGS
ncbi:MAG: DUF167 domain-containing protein [Chloroflexi bacterium]|nr:DUF167 domain-containing protein [Chloroflexota bacterium]